jgi:hypothetical protein
MRLGYVVFRGKGRVRESVSPSPAAEGLGWRCSNVGQAVGEYADRGRMSIGESLCVGPVNCVHDSATLSNALGTVQCPPMIKTSVAVGWAEVHATTARSAKQLPETWQA